jgi:HK97 family phage major capsid protein/HK97 family phage prohead protease
MKEPLKLRPLERAAEASSIVIRKEGDTNTITFTASSEQPIDRWFGQEILSHSKDAIQLDRIVNGSAPLLFNHDWNDPVGMLDSARIENSKLVVDAHFFSTDRANEVRAMIEGGLRNVSIGYRINVIEEDVNENTFTAMDWEPFEVSIVTIPADPSVGIGRTLGEELEVRMIRPPPKAVGQPVANNSNEVATEARQVRASSILSTTAQPAISGGTNVSEVTQAAAGTSAEVNVTAVQAERERREAIIAMCKSNKIDSRVEARWIEEGAPLTKVANEILNVMEERGKAKPATAAQLGLSRGETQQYSLIRAIRALKFPTQRNLESAGFEIECSRAVAQKLNRGDTGSIFLPSEVLTRSLDVNVMERAMATTPGSKGGYMVNVTNMGFIDILRNRSVAMRMGARQLSGLEGNVTFARQTGKQSVTWQGGEGTSITAADQTLGQLSMTPKTAICVTDVSEQLLRQASPSAEQFIMADLASVIAIDGVDNAVINGAGGAQPIGIKNTTGITSGQDAASATYAKILAFVSAAGALNAIRGNPGFVTTTAGAAKLMQVQRFTSTDTPLWTGNMLDGECVGFNAMSSEQLSSGNIIFGSWDEVVIGDWGVLELSTDNGGTRFNQAQVGIRALWMVDVMIRYPTAFVVGTNLS